MSVYSVLGSSQFIVGDTNNNSTALSVVSSSEYSISGAQGPVVVKLTNDSTTDTFTVSYVSDDTTYDFLSVSGTASLLGANATFDVTVTNSAYTTTLVNGGDSYVPTETVTIAGTNLGGASPANDLVITVSTVDGNGTIQTFTSAGTQLWPQAVQGVTYVSPLSSDFVQINNGLAKDSTFFGVGASGNLWITPVTVS